MKYILFSHKQRILGAFLAVLMLFGLSTPARAEAPMVKTQVPGYYRMMIGQFEVTALYDGYVSLDSKLLKNIPEAEVQNLLARMFVSTPKMQTAINAYLINTGANLVLVDAGAANLFGPTSGSLLQNLKAAGYDPSQVDTVLITHMHRDHIGGLLTAEGKPIFTKATIYVAKKDSDFFLSTANEDSVPADKKRFFTMARTVAAPYLALGTWKTFEEGGLSVPGIKAIPIPGHTPGHTAYEVRSGEQTLLIWGDVVHSMAVQFSNPDVSIEFDINQQQAIGERKALFKQVASHKTLVAGAHLPFPGIGRVRADAENMYTWIPVVFSPLQ
jgi:glyoxylase-like metal-dependent hydrolase (beta-lactamase superfamily II)